MSTLSLLGFAQKAGGVVAGLDAAQRAIERRRARLVLVATDASLRTRAQAVKACAKAGVRLVHWGEKEALGRALGIRDVAIVAIIHPQFSAAIARTLLSGEEEKGRDGYDKTTSLRVGPKLGPRK